ncbi:10293_t:CDS:2 [Dentiscutata heterogama]|uniref:10293_t:CDS:1 n=1 Tax=Dentiscutata heterogama TaxID=1316150 RepID=A0ACA9N0I3_9GLOM|nr:10293_t:CDS:2 [Dentiscutata heterogama]
MSQANKKSGGRPPASLWDVHIKKGNEVSKGHYQGTCNYCSYSQHKGSPQDFEEHLANNCPNVPRYNPPSSEVLSGRIFSQEVSSINIKIIQKLNYSKNLTLEMNKSDIAKKELLYQMKLYRIREEPFDISYSDSENPSVWWFSLEDCFPKNEDYLVQLALKLFSVIPHTAGVEHVWSRLGWIYGTRRNRLGLHKIENMQKLASYYNSHAKQELPYYSIEKTNNEVYEILMNENLDVDKNFIEITKDSLNDENNETEIFDEEDNLLISNVLDLNKFCSDLDELEFSIDEEYNVEENYSEVEAISNLTQEAQENVNWDPVAEIDKIVEDL